MATIFDSVIVGFDRSEQAMDALPSAACWVLLNPETSPWHTWSAPPAAIRGADSRIRAGTAGKGAQGARTRASTAGTTSACSRLDRRELTGAGPLRAGRRATQIRCACARDRLHPPRPDRSRAGGQRRRAVGAGGALCRDRRAARVRGAGPSGIGRCGGRLRRFARVTRGFACRPRARARSQAQGSAWSPRCTTSIFTGTTTGARRKMEERSRRGWTKRFPSSAATSIRPSSRAIRSISSPRRRKGRHLGTRWTRLRADAPRAGGQCLDEAHALRSQPGAGPAAFGPRPRWPKRAQQRASILGGASSLQARRHARGFEGPALAGPAPVAWAVRACN